MFFSWIWYKIKSLYSHLWRARDIEKTINVNSIKNVNYLQQQINHSFLSIFLKKNLRLLRDLCGQYYYMNVLIRLVHSIRSIALYSLNGFSFEFCVKGVKVALKVKKSLWYQAMYVFNVVIGSFHVVLIFFKTSYTFFMNIRIRSCPVQKISVFIF